MYEINSFFFYKFQFLVELLLAEGIFFIHLKRKKFFFIRALSCFLVCSGITFAIPAASYDPLYLSAIFFFIFMTTVLSLYICFDEPFINILFGGIAGYTIQHIAFCFYQIFMIGTQLDGGTSLDMYGTQVIANWVIWFMSFYILVIIYAVVYLATYFLIGRKLKTQKDFYINNKWLFGLTIIVLISAILLNSYMVNISDAKTDRFQLIISFLYGILSCILTLILEFKLKDAKRTEKELEIANYLWKQDKQHYELAKENIDIINIKCHDLKHQISAIRHGNKMDPEALKEIENSISIYGSIIKTGNDALDVVLTEKSLLCNEKNITLTYIADGEKISFMSSSNIYSLFGNALDNAIEYLLKKDVNQRFIRLHIKSINDMVSIHIENFCNDDIKIVNGLPKTTKSDKDFHGFGLISMKRIVESYDGEMFVKKSNNLFVINILMPNNLKTSK